MCSLSQSSSYMLRFLDSSHFMRIAMQIQLYLSVNTDCQMSLAINTETFCVASVGRGYFDRINYAAC